MSWILDELPRNCPGCGRFMKRTVEPNKITAECTNKDFDHSGWDCD